jgi:hypothetical protein
MKENIPEKEMDLKFMQPAGITLNCLLLTHLKNGNKQTGDAFRDETSVYISSLMAAFKDPGRVEHLKPYLMEPDIALFRRLDKARDARAKYVIHKTEDDLLLVSVGVFENGDAEGFPKEAEYTNGKQGQMGRGESHFRFAFTYTQLASCPADTIGNVLKELNTGFAKYVTIVSYILGCTYDLKTRFAGAETYILDRSIEESLRQDRIKRKQDEFLDAYLRWREAPADEHDSGKLRNHVESLAAELRELDPSFNFNPT